MYSFRKLNMTLLLTTGFQLSIDKLVDFVSKCNKDSLTNNDLDESLMCLLNIKNDMDLNLLKLIIRKTNLCMTSEHLLNHTTGNPVYLSYVRWKNSWRAESIKSSYDWRISSENFTDLLADDFQNYLQQLSLISCTYVESVDQDELQRASDYINSIGRDELQTVVVDNVIKLKNDCI